MYIQSTNCTFEYYIASYNQNYNLWETQRFRDSADWLTNGSKYTVQIWYGFFFFNVSYWSSWIFEVSDVPSCLNRTCNILRFWFIFDRYWLMGNSSTRFWWNYLFPRIMKLKLYFIWLLISLCYFQIGQRVIFIVDVSCDPSFYWILLFIFLTSICPNSNGWLVTIDTWFLKYGTEGCMWMIKETWRGCENLPIWFDFRFLVDWSANSCNMILFRTLN